MTRILIGLFLIIPLAASSQNRFPPRDESKQSPELELFVAELKDYIQTADKAFLVT